MAVRRKPKPLLIILISILVFILLIIAILAFSWKFFTSPVDKSSNADIEVVIPSGKGVIEIAQILKEKNLIRNKTVFRLYIKLNDVTSLKASTYTMRKSMDLKEIVRILEDGNAYNPDAIKLTFKEGKTIADYIKLIASTTNNKEDDIYSKINDRVYISTLINEYWFLTEEILQPEIYYPLEGYLFPNTYYFENKDVTVETIIETMLNETEKQLSKYKNTIGQNINKYIIMASLVELEGTNTTNRKMIAGVFNNRLARGMNLGSDVTTYYGLQHPMTSDLTAAQFNAYNPYNTRSEKMAGKLPIGAICNPSISSIESSINPTENDYLFFVADKHGNIFYTKTIGEHNKKVKEIKDKGDWIW